MVEVNKESNRYVSNEIFIRTNEGKFSISLGEDNNLYIGLYKLQNSNEDEITFTITKENYYVFSYFNRLYNDIKNNKPRYVNQNLLLNEDFIDIMKRHNPINKEIIEWHSEDSKYSESSVMKIYKEQEDEIKITFKKGNSKEYVNNYFVRVNSKKSNYYPFNFDFIELYKQLDEYSSNKYHQIHIEEYKYNMTRTRK